MPASIYNYTPQYASSGARPLTRAVVAWIAVAGGALLFVGVLFLAPFLLARGNVAAAKSIYQGFSIACHQQSARSFHAWGHPLAVCARCTGVYVGLAAGVLLYPLARSLKDSYAPARKWLFLAVLPTSLDFLLGFFGVWENTHLSRSLTAALLGVVAAFYVVPGVVDFAARRRHLSEALPTSVKKGMKKYG